MKHLSGYNPVTMVREPKTEPMTIRFSQTEIEALRQVSAAEDLSAAAIVRRALREYIERNAKPKRAR